MSLEQGTLVVSLKVVNRDEQNKHFCWPTSQLILMLGILIGGRFWDFKCLTWNFLIWKQQNLHVKENDQHLFQLLPNKLFTPFTTVLLVSINVFEIDHQKQHVNNNFQSLKINFIKLFLWLHSSGHETSSWTPHKPVLIHILFSIQKHLHKYS